MTDGFSDHTESNLHENDYPTDPRLTDYLNPTEDKELDTFFKTCLRRRPTHFEVTCNDLKTVPAEKLLCYVKRNYLPYAQKGACFKLKEAYTVAQQAKTIALNHEIGMTEADPFLIVCKAQRMTAPPP